MRFYVTNATYNKQLIDREWKKRNLSNVITRRAKPDKHGINNELQEWKEFDGKKKNPSSVINFDVTPRSLGTLHPTQKPVALIEYLIKTYSLEGELILDNTAGSGTLAIACINTNRRYICIENDEYYFEVMKSRIEKHDPNVQEKTKKPKNTPQGQLNLF